MIAAMDESDSAFAALNWRSLSALRAFDTAARLGSFRAAAEALNLTPSAVSHQIKALEGHLGARLFHREGRAVALTEAGARLAPHVRQGFAAFARGAAAVQAGPRARQIRVSSLGLFNQMVLIPSLPRFSRRHPDYEVRVEAKADFVDFETDDVDVAIRVGDGRWPGLTSTALLAICGAPVASPAFAAAHAIATPADLAAVRLVHDTALPDGWRRWLEIQGVARAAQSGDLWFDSAPATLQAAEQGLGVALAIDPLIRLWPGYGERLAPLFPGLAAPRTRYWLVCRPGAEADVKIRAFVRWLVQACRDLGAGDAQGPPG